MQRVVPWLAFVGVAAVAAYYGISDPPAGRGVPTFAWIVVGLAVGTALLVFPSRIARRALTLDLLFTVAARALAYVALGWIVLLPAAAPLRDPLANVVLGSIAVRLSVALLLSMVIDVLYAAWVTPMIWRAAQGEAHSWHVALREAPRRWLRAFALLALGVATTFGLAVLAFASGIGALREPGIAALALGFALWNVWTAPLLLFGLGEGRGVAASVHATLARWPRWRVALPVTIFAVLMGCFTWVSGWTYTGEGPDVASPTPVETRRGAWTHVTWRDRSSAGATWVEQKNANGEWYGGYAHETDWLSDAAEAYDRPVPALLGFLAGLLLALAAIAVKLRIAGALRSLVFLGAIASLAGCGDGVSASARDEDAKIEAFLSPAPARFHVRSLEAASSSMFRWDQPDAHALEVLRAHLPAEGANEFRTLALEYVCGSPARFRLEIADRAEGVAGEPGADRDTAGRGLLTLEQDVAVGRRLVLGLSVVEIDEGWRLTALLLGGSGPVESWPAQAQPVGPDEAPAGVLVTTEVRGVQAFPGGGRGHVFGTPFGLVWRYAYLANDFGVRFPVVDWIAVDETRWPSGSRRMGSGTGGDGFAVHYDSEHVSMRGDGVEYEIALDGERVEDLRTWAAPVWMVRGMFLRPGEAPPPPPAPPPPLLAIELDADGVMRFDGRSYELSGSDEAMEAALAALRVRLMKLARAHPELRDAGVRQGVLVHGDRDAKWQYVQWIMQVAAHPSIRIHKLQFAVKKGE